MEFRVQCDQCIAWAVARVELESGGQLYFCNHHFIANQSALTPMARTLTFNLEPAR